MQKERRMIKNIVKIDSRIQQQFTEASAIGL